MTAPQQPARRGRPGHDLESVLQCAATLFVERGYDGTSMEDLARKLGVTKSAIYHHVSSKEELLQLIVDRALDALSAVADEVQAMPGPAIDRLEHLVRGSVAVLADRLPFVTVLLRVRGNTEAERAALARRKDFDQFAAGLVQRAEADGDVRADVDPLVTSRLLFGMVNSLVEWYRPRGGIAGPELADAICAIAFGGLRVRR